MGLLIQNGEIITASERYFADIYCEDETITAIGKDLDVPEGTEVVDASGKYVFPGFIDATVTISGSGPSTRSRTPSISDRSAPSIRGCCARDASEQRRRFCSNRRPI